MPRSRPLMRSAALTAFLVVAASLGAAPAPSASSGPAGQPLASTSPFLPPGVTDTGATGATQGGAIELRGEMSTPTGLAFCIYDTVAKKATWIHEGEQGYPFLVKAHDLNRDSITVAYQGRTMALQMPAAKVLSSGVGAAPTLNVASATPSVDDAQKLAAIAAEVARRRQMREQELQKGGNGTAGLGPQPGQAGPQQIPVNGQPPLRRRQMQPPQ